ncbi:MAG: 3'-5' exonuclease [Flavobacteriales bacterium]|nr:3'-5' exonuclease [Flavobacteriales bacterium]
MLHNIPLNKVLFLDIETVPITYRYAELSEREQYLWNGKTQWIQKREEISPEQSYEKAGIYAEFAKVICVSCGFFYSDGEQTKFRIKSFFGHEEKALLANFIQMVKKFSKRDDFLLCAHNGKEFDFPFLGRRILINDMELPYALDIAGKKPWEVKHLDTMELWKFGDYKHYTSVDLLAHVLGVPSPKNDITGADVSRVYYEDKDLEKIVRYCEGDVVTIARLMQKFKGYKPLEDASIVRVVQ